jgi:hypothetical protein
MTERDETQVPQDVEARLQALAREASRAVPTEVMERLGNVRREAVALLDEPPSRWSAALGWPGLATGMVATALVGTIGVWLYLGPGPDPLAVPLVTEPEVAIVQDMELLEELEFLAWLEEESQGAG